MIIRAANWWAFVLRGIIAVLFGPDNVLLAELALLTMVFLFGFYAIVDGVFNISAATAAEAGKVERAGGRS